MTYTDYPTGQTSIWVAVADFNGDANPDLVVANVNAGGVRVLLGDGDGGIASSHSLVTVSAPRKIVTGDWDRDGITDLAVVVGTSHALAIHRGNGDGTFSEATFYGPAFSDAFDLATGDLNGDGFADIAVSATSIMILLGRGDGGFVLGESPGAGGGSVVISDINGDSDLDLAMSSGGSSTATVLLGRGTARSIPSSILP